MSTKHKILIVDDNANLRETLHHIIEGKGYTSIAADSGKTALRRTMEEKPVVALIDLKLQDMPGLEVMKEIKRQSPDTECIVLTGYATKESAIEAINLGAYAYVQKPCDIEQLLLTIQRAFEKHKTEEELQLFRNLINQSNDAVFVIDPKTSRFLDVNDNTYISLGYTREELLSMNVMDTQAFSPDNFSWYKRVEEVRARGNMVLEGVHKRKDSTTFPVEVGVEYIIHDKADYIVAVARDITERKRTDEVLQRKHQLQIVLNTMLSISLKPYGLVEILDRILEHITSIPWLSLPRGAIFLVEDEPNELVLKSYRSFYGKPASQCNRVPFGKCLCGRAALTKKIEFSDCIDERHEILYEDISPHGHYCVPILSSGKILGVLSLYLEVGHRRTKEEEDFLLGIADGLAGVIERKRAEEEKLKLRHQLAQAQKMESIGRLASGIAHDFNNILFVVNGFAELTLQKMDKNTPSHKYVETILEAGTNAKNLTQQLLAFSRNQLNKPQILDLNTTLINMQNMIIRLIGEDINTNMIMGKQLWNIKADRSQIEQVIMNLAVNARDAMPGGGNLTIKMENIVIDNRKTKELSDIKEGKYVLMTISDTGHGMPEEIRECIFEPFFTTKKEGEGTGLGLATVYGIIKQNSGFIYVYSELNKGTVFKIYLPYSEEETQSNVVKTFKYSAYGTETVLVAEDDKSVRGIVVKMLSTLGYTVLEAMNGPSALQIYKKYNSKIDLLLIDVVMPKMDGHELSRQIKELNPEIKIIFMSGHTDDTIRNHGVIKNEIIFLQKPIISLSLAQTIRRVLDN